MSKPRKAADLVLEAIRNLRSKKGFTSQEILGYIQTKYPTISSRTVKCVHTALQRGQQCGILSEQQGRYVVRAVTTKPVVCVDGPEPECGCGKRYNQRRTSSKRRRQSSHKKRKSCRSKSRSKRRSSKRRSCGRRKKIHHTSRCKQSQVRRRQRRSKRRSC